MTRSDRFSEAVAALDAHRSTRRPESPDLFSVAEPAEPDAWKSEALAAIRSVAERAPELTVEDVPFPPALDNRSRGWAMQEASRRGWLKSAGWATGGASRHGRPVRLWASRIFTAHQMTIGGST